MEIINANQLSEDPNFAELNPSLLMANSDYKELEFDLDKEKVFKPRVKESKLNDNNDDLNFIKLKNETLEFIMSFSNKALIDNLTNNDSYKSCLDSLNSTDNFIKMIQMSGKSINDMGAANNCKKDENMTYVLLQINFNQSFPEHTFFEEILQFKDQNYFFTGLCFVKNCCSFFGEYFNQTKNPEFFIFLDSVTIKNISNTNDKKCENLTDEISTIFKIFLTFLAIYFLLIIILSVFGMIYFNYYEKEENDDKISEINSNNEILEKDQPSMVFSASIEKVSTNWKVHNIWYRLFKFFSIKDKIKKLFIEKSFLFDDTNLQVINSLKVLYMFFYTLNHNYYTLDLIPNRYYGYQIFYKSTLFSLVKFSSFAADIIVLLDGFIFSYKYLNFFKKYDSSTLLHHLIFIGNIFTKIPCFYFIFFFFYMSVNNISIITGKGNLFDLIFAKRISNRTCYKYPIFALIPFYFNYYLKVNENDNCYRFLLFYTTELGCMILMILIFYITSRFRSSRLDLFISVLIILSGGLSFLFAYQIPSGNLTIRFILGDNLIYYRIEQMFFGYFLGVLGGIVYFYYCDIISENPIKDNSNYIPFYFCLIIMNFFDRIESKLKNLLLIFSITGRILLCFVFTLYLLTSSNSIIIKNTNFSKFIFTYEKQIFQFLYLIYLLLILISIKGRFLQTFLTSDWTNFITRVSFVFISIVHSTTYLFYAKYDMDLFMNYKNIFLTSIGIFVFVFIISTIIVILFEIPLRILYKKFTFWYLIERTKVSN